MACTKKFLARREARILDIDGRSPVGRRPALHTSARLSELADFVKRIKGLGVALFHLEVSEQS